MTTTEDSWTVDTTEVTPEVTPETVEAPVVEATPEITTIQEVAPAEEVTPTTEEQTIIDEKVNSLSESDIDDLLKAITDWISSEEPEIITEPNSFEKKDEEPMTEEEMDVLENLISSQEEQILEKDNKITELSTQIESEIQKQNAIEEIWSKVVTHPIIWPFAEQIAKWENPNIPDIILNQLQKEIDSIPNIWNTQQVSIKPTPVSNASRIYWVKTLWE